MKKQHIVFLYSIKMSENTLIFGNVEFNEKEFHASKNQLL